MEIALDKTYQYVVEGRGEFPLDMLRRDNAVPVSAADRALVEATIENNAKLLEEGEGGRLLRRYRVTLQTDERSAPLTKRWESFGFRVVEVGSNLFGEVSEPLGRPRVHPSGTSGAERAAIADRKLEEAGGTRRTVRFSPAAVEALQVIRGRTGETSDTDVIERLLAEELERTPAPGLSR